MRHSPLDRKYRCCLCCHIRTGALAIGIWHSLVHILVLGVLAAMIVRPELFCLRDQQQQQLQQQQQQLIDTPIAPAMEVQNDSFLSELASAEDDTSQDDYYVYKYGSAKMTRQDKCIGFIITACSFLITLVMVYGTIKHRPTYLIPFFCLQVFDFCVSCLSIFSYFIYTHDVKYYLMTHANVPFQKQLLAIDTQLLTVLVFSFLMVILLVKAYLMGIVWACYKYLLEMNTGHVSTIYMEPELAPDSQVLLPPKYEEAMKQPPPY